MKRDLTEILKHTERSWFSGCLEWTRCLNSDGYPRAAFDGNYNGKVHREVFFLVNGFYPQTVRHTCDNTMCLNPKHLVAGTPTSNMKDRNKRGRTANHVSDKEKRQVKKLRKMGWLYKDIAAKLNIKPRRVEHICLRT